MPYAIKLYIYIGVCFTAALVLADPWLGHFRGPFVFSFSMIYAVMTIIVGRWLFGPKDSVGSQSAISSSTPLAHHINICPRYFAGLPIRQMHSN